MLTSDTSKDVFVFGSNTAGIHGRGAAKFARERYGARNGEGVGFTGRAYAFPTKSTPYQALPFSAVQGYAEQFIRDAIQHSHLRFLLTRVGCGLAAAGSGSTGRNPGFVEEEIAGLFVNAPDNVFSIDDHGKIVGPAREWLTRLKTPQ